MTRPPLAQHPTSSTALANLREGCPAYRTTLNQPFAEKFKDLNLNIITREVLEVLIHTTKGFRLG